VFLCGLLEAAGKYGDVTGRTDKHNILQRSGVVEVRMLNANFLRRVKGLQNLDQFLYGHFGVPLVLQ
jgi:hypothetical protein